MDIVLALRRAEGGGLPNVRVIHALSRFDETPDRLTIELSEDGRYTSHGDGEALGSRMARDYLLKALPDAEGDAMRIDELADGSGMSKAKLHSAAKELHSEGLIGRLGDGVKGSPYGYWNSIRQDSTSKGRRIESGGMRMVWRTAAEAETDGKASRLLRTPLSAPDGALDIEPAGEGVTLD